MIIPVGGNILIKELPILDADGGVMSLSLQTHRKGEVVAVGDEVGTKVKPGDIVLLNKSNFFLLLGDVVLLHCSAIFALEKDDNNVEVL